ncbi:methionine aminopeptidase-like [Drosophila innubila]|uniref:methionine aminopeptidase-like n=1 Tax=Drosophila innubila TaxID=198719 RepID=UPI00148E0E33|nr:methionine aminopeptidase-like [Drosophila innubila]
MIGTVAPKARRLVEMTFEAMWAGIRQVKPGARLGDIGHAIQSHAQANGSSVVREYCGHGIGRQMHEEPQVLHVGRPGWVDGGDQDNSLSAQWEHTVAVTADGFEVLTLQS